MKLDERKAKVEIERQFNKVGRKFVIKNDNKVTSFNADTITLGELADVVSTLIKTLQDTGKLEK